MAFIRRAKMQAGEWFESVLSELDTEVAVLRGRDNQVLAMNAAAKKRLDEAGGNGDYVSCFAGLAEALAREGGERPRVCETEDGAGSRYSARASTIMWPDDGKPALLLCLRDVSEERQVQQRLYNLAYVDALTGVPNRLRFKQDFEALEKQIAAGELCGVVAIFDLDNFKGINDTYGHNTGDVMLRRLAEHLNSSPAFFKHLYRLGGDEFVLFFAEPAEKFATKQAIVEHYGQLLAGAFLTYTMPNIEASCTISMGAAPFPAYGENASELLRKADIALYKAKEGGKNRLAFFEDRYDSAKKFKDLYINIQPVLTASGTTFGYELIDRGNEGKGEEDSLNLAEFDRTMDALGLGDMASDARYFISFTNQLLSATVLNNLPKDKFIIQIHEGADCTPQQMQKYRELRRHGYTLALTDVYAEQVNPSFIDMADYLKFARGGDAEDQRKLIAAYPKKRFIATGVDSGAAFSQAKQAGFKLFQGFFFNQPTEVRKTKDIDPLKVNYLRLLRLTSTDDYVDFAQISTVIASDVALSYKLLRLLNSAAVGLRNPVSSIDMALAYLGEANLKQWIAMLALRGVASDKPLELVRMSLIRAHFGELLSPRMVPKRDARHVFLVGLFSLLHIAMEKTPQEVLEDIPVAESIKESLLTKDGPYSDMVAFFRAYEYANWDEVAQFGQKNGLSDRLVNDSYIASVKWFNDLAEG